MNNNSNYSSILKCWNLCEQPTWGSKHSTSSVKTKHTKKKNDIKKKPGMGRWSSKVQVLNTCPIVHYITPSHSPLSLHLSSHHSLSLSLTLTDQQYRQQQSLGEKVFQGIKVAQRRQKWRGRFKRSFKLWEGTAVSDVGRKFVPDKGHLNRERSVTKALEFPFCAGRSFHQNWNGEYKMECTQRDRMKDEVRWRTGWQVKNWNSFPQQTIHVPFLASFTVTMWNA